MYKPEIVQSVLLSDGKVVFEHILKQAIQGSALCTVCIRCGSTWWTPKPGDPESYSPRYCEREDGPPVGVFIMLNDYNGKAWDLYTHANRETKTNV